MRLTPLLMVICATFSAEAQHVPASAYGAMHWRMIGPFRGGRVLAVAGVPGDGATFYFGSVDGGVWRTTNAGVTWEPLFDGQPISSIGALALAPSDPKVIFAGTGEADMRSDITYGAGVYKSTDGGAHWQHLGLDDTRQIGKVLIDPQDPNIVWVAALGHAYGPNTERGVFKSTDGGRTWQKVLYKNPDVGAIDLAFDPSDARIVYAALWQSRRPPWSQYPPDQGPGSGLYKTTDGGATWKQLAGGGFPAGQSGRIGLATARGAAGTRVYALLEAGAATGLYRSDDGGATWVLTSSDPRLTTRNWYFGQVFVDPSDAGVVYVPNRPILRSTDGGKTFTAIKGSPGGDDYHIVWIDPKNGHRLIFGSDQGAGVSLDGGATWSSWYNQPTAQFYHVVTDDAFPYRVYGAQQDAGTVGTASRGNDGSITFREWHPVGAGEAGYIAPDPLNPDIVYGGDTYGAAFRFDRTTGQSQIISPAAPGGGRSYRFTWTSPLVFDRLDRHVLYLGAQMVLRTRDGGLHWEEASPDLTGVVPGRGVVYTIAPSPVQAGVIWAGTDDGRIHVTADGGRNWRNVTPDSLPAWSRLSMIEASPFEAGAAYAAVDRHESDDVTPWIYRTHDFGRHWTRIEEGIAPGAYVAVVRADPTRRGLLFAGTELGVYVSFDDGDHWQSLQLNLPVASVRDLAVHDHDLVAATHGRAFWILDDLTPLEQLSDSALAAGTFLFRPEAALRVRRSTNNDTPLPPEEPQGENPPAGAILDYYLATAPTGPVTLEITDGRGAVIRRYSSDDRAPAPAEAPYFMDVWLPRAAIPTRAAGHNRFVWDLRYAPPPVERVDYSIAAIAGHGTIAQPEGPLVVPGTYQVRLTVNGKTQAQPLDVKLDPRSHPADTALAAQLALALAISRAQTTQDSLRMAAIELARRLRAAGPRLGATAAAADSVAKAAGDGALADLLTVVESADREPTQQARDAYASQLARLVDLRRRWDAIRKLSPP
jgi:photosystem II stability/assembly factor-like uncharacterized protein